MTNRPDRRPVTWPDVAMLAVLGAFVLGGIYLLTGR